MFGLSLVPGMIAAERRVLLLYVQTGPERSFVASARAHGFELGMLVVRVGKSNLTFLLCVPALPASLGGAVRAKIAASSSLYCWSNTSS